MILKYFKGIARSEYIYISILNNRIFFFVILSMILRFCSIEWRKKDNRNERGKS